MKRKKQIKKLTKELRKVKWQMHDKISEAVNAASKEVLGIVKASEILMANAVIKYGEDTGDGGKKIVIPGKAATGSRMEVSIDEEGNRTFWVKE